MSVCITYIYTCDHCGAVGEADGPTGMHGWLQLGISGSPEPSPFVCSWRCLLVTVAQLMAAEPIAPHSH